MDLRTRSPLAWVTAGVFLHFMCWRLLTPLMPLWAGHLGATPLAVGALLTGYAATDLACAPVLGAPFVIAGLLCLPGIALLIVREGPTVDAGGDR